MNKKINVACGVIFDKDGNILMGRRPKNYENPRYWEFPGGKQEKNESLEQCLMREWKEEFNLDIFVHEQLMINENDNYKCYFFSGKILYKNLIDIDINDHDCIGFFNPKEINKLDLFEGDIEILNHVSDLFNI